MQTLIFSLLCEIENIKKFLLLFNFKFLSKATSFLFLFSMFFAYIVCHKHLQHNFSYNIIPILFNLYKQVMIKENNSNEIDKNKVVALSELITEPECLKLLILHTPFSIKIDSLHLCINLVKLDLSRNKIATFPYLGQLTNLKFIFIHENSLDVEALMGIFQEEDKKKSPLSRSILWVTFWGNKNQFLARHYLATSTSVLAVDLNMICPQQKDATMSFQPEKGIKLFSTETSVVDIFEKRKKFGKNATEEQYMHDFWGDVSALRKKYVQLVPIIKIQKNFRGWRVRKERAMQKQKLQNVIKVLRLSFMGWKKQAKYERKLRKILQKKNKEYYLLPLKEMKLHLAKQKIIDYARRVKTIYHAKLALMKPERRFYMSLVSHRNFMRDLYRVLQLEKSTRIYIMNDGKQPFDKYILPLLKKLKKDGHVEPHQNKTMMLRWAGSTFGLKKQFIKMLKNNEDSMVSMYHQREVRAREINYSILRSRFINLKPLYKKHNIFLSKKGQTKIKNILSNFQLKDKLTMNEVFFLEGDTEFLKDIARAIYFYNTGYFTQNKPPQERIILLSQYHAEKVSAVIKIQKVWRGFSCRKKIAIKTSTKYTERRAAVIIQRWFRALARRHRKNFMNENLWILRQFDSEKFYIKLEDYFNALKTYEQLNITFSRLTFNEQNIRPYLDKKLKKLVIFWKNNEKQIIQKNFRQRKSLFYEQYMKDIFGEPIIEMMSLFRALPRQKSMKRFVGVSSKLNKGQSESESYSPRSMDENFRVFSDVDESFSERFQQLEISHLFHYQTNVSLFSRRYKQQNFEEVDKAKEQETKIIQYLQVKCNSKFQCRLRVLAIKLLCYSFNYHSTFRKDSFIIPAQFEVKPQGRQMVFNQKVRMPISNNKSVFISEREGNHQIEAQGAQNLKQIIVPVKFYLKNYKKEDWNKKDLLEQAKPVKIESELKILLLQNDLADEDKNESMSNKKSKLYEEYYPQLHPQANFYEIQIDRFLLTEDIRDQTNSKIAKSETFVEQNVSEFHYPYKKHVYQHHNIVVDLPQPNAITRLDLVLKNSKKKQLSNIKAERLFKLKKKKQLRELKEIEREQTYQYNYLISNGKYHQSKVGQQEKIAEGKYDRLKTQPDINLTQQRSLGSMVSDQPNIRSMQSIKSLGQNGNRILFKQNREQQKKNRKKAESFAMNFINQNNFIQKQVLSSQIKRIRTQHEYQSLGKYERIKTEEAQIRSEIKKQGQERRKAIQQKKQVHKDLLLQSYIDKSKNTQNQTKIINERKHESLTRGNNSQGRKIKITFAEECYPIINKKR